MSFSAWRQKERSIDNSEKKETRRHTDRRSNTKVLLLGKGKRGKSDVDIFSQTRTKKRITCRVGKTETERRRECSLLLLLFRSYYR